MGTESFLIALSGYLAGVGLVQFDADGSYVDDPDRPAILFGSADTPDNAVAITVTGRNDALGTRDVALTYRATGVDGRGAERFADAISDHFEDTFGFGTGTWHGGTLVAPPTVTLPGGIVLADASQVARGTTELTSPAKHKGSRYVRVDTYRFTVKE